MQWHEQIQVGISGFEDYCRDDLFKAFHLDRLPDLKLCFLSYPLHVHDTFIQQKDMPGLSDDFLMVLRSIVSWPYSSLCSSSPCASPSN